MMLSTICWELSWAGDGRSAPGQSSLFSNIPRPQVELDSDYGHAPAAVVVVTHCETLIEAGALTQPPHLPTTLTV